MTRGESKARHVLLTVGALPLLVLLARGSAVAQQEMTTSGVRFSSTSVSVVPGQKEAAAADLDGDGLAEVVITGNAQVTVLGWQDAEMKVEGRYPAGDNPVGSAFADLDADGQLDIAIANHETRYVTLLRGDGKGGLQPFPDSPLTIEVDPHPHDVEAADLDGDGRDDLVVDHRAGEGLLILRGLGGGELESPGVFVAAGGDPYRGMAVGDLNGDGRLDLVTPNPASVGLLLQDARQALSFDQREIGTAAGPFAVELADLNGDDRLDVVAALDEGSSRVQVFLGDGEGAFREAHGSPFDFVPGGKMLARGDFNGDGTDDVAVSAWSAPNVLLLLGHADAIRTARVAGGENTWGIAAADLNGDGVDDLVIPDAASDQVLFHISHRR